MPVRRFERGLERRRKTRRLTHALFGFLLVNSISANGETSTGLIKDISFGVLAPGVHATKTLTLSSGGAAGSRLLDISISAHSPQSEGATEVETEEQTDDLDDPTSPTQLDKTIHQQTIVVPTVAPFAVSNDVTYVRDREEWPGPASLETFEDESFDPRKGTEALVNVTFSCTGPWSVYIENIALETVVSHCGYPRNGYTPDIYD